MLQTKKLQNPQQLFAVEEGKLLTYQIRKSGF
jgi:hypothetical protein